MSFTILLYPLDSVLAVKRATQIICTRKERELFFLNE